MRTVPANIAKPPYAETGSVPRLEEGRVKTPEVIERMRIAGDAAREILRQAGEFVRPGITTDAIDVFVHELTIKMGGYPSPLNYHNYPKSVCTSVNEVICHGIPDSRVLLDGDIINLDVTIFLNGVHGDTNASFAVGNISDEDAQLIRVTEECMWYGIEAVKPDRPLSDIGKAIEDHAKIHGKERLRSIVTLKCPWCESIFDRYENKTFLVKGGTYTACSRSCNGKLSSKLSDNSIVDKIKKNVVKKYQGKLIF